jgi:hypothetical protein
MGLLKERREEVLTSRLMLIEMPRVGGTFFRNLLRRVPGLEIWDHPGWGQHTGHAKMRARCQELGKDVPPSVAFTRHPYSWYLSCWCYHTINDLPGISFPEFLEWMDGTPKTHPWPRWTYSATWKHLGADRATHVARYENFYGEIRRVLAATMGDLIGDDVVRWLLAGLPRPRPPSGLWPYGERLSGYDPKSFWNEDMKQWLGDRDGALMKEQGYEL